MSIAALYELQERLYNTAIAGVNMINEDFRLQRSMEQFEQTAGASPVFKKIAEQLKPLREAQAIDKPAALMDALALIDAVLYTQGATEVKGELAPIAVKASGSNYYEIRYSELNGLKAALTEKGAGRYEIVKSAFDVQSPALKDFRLRNVLIAALGDSYSEMADLVAEILASGDAGMVPLLKEGFDSKGKREMARRVEVIEKLAKEEENEFYLSLLDKASPAIRLAAVHALKHDTANAELLMSLAETEKGELREAAFSSLYELKQSDTRAFWLKHAEHSPNDVASYLFDDIGDDVSDIIANRLGSLLDAIVSSTQNGKQAVELTEKQYNELDSLIYMSTNKASSRLIEMFASVVALAKPLSKVKVSPHISYGRYGQDSHNDLLREINLVLTRGIVLDYNEQLVAAGTHLYENCGLPYLHVGFCAALVSKPAAEVYEKFAPYLSDKTTAETIVRALSFVSYDQQQEAYCLYSSSYDGADNWGQSHSGKHLYEELDPRWLELLVSSEVRGISKYKQISNYTVRTVTYFCKDDIRERYDVILMGLINRNNKEAVELLKQHFLQGANDLYSEIPLVALQRLGETNFHEWIIGMLQQPKFSEYRIQYLCQRLKLSTEQTVAVIEDMIGLIEAKKLKTRYFTVENLKDSIVRLQTEGAVYW